MIEVILDSEQSNECIDFIKICVFFFCSLQPFGALKILQTSTLRVVPGIKSDLDGESKVKNSRKIPTIKIIVKKRREILKKT